MRRSAGLTPALAAILLLSTNGLASGDGLLVRGGTVWTISGDTLEGADVLVLDGRIAAVGPQLSAPDGARTIEANGKHVCPGFVDAHSHLGLARAERDEEVAPGATDTLVLDAFWAGRKDIRRAASSGVTTILLAPGYTNPIGGRCSAVKLGPGRVLKRDAAVKLVLAESALMRDRKPTSMPGLLDMLRQELSAAARAEGEGELLADAVRGEMPVQMFCDGVASTERAAKLANEFGLRASVMAPDAAHKLPRILEGTGLSVICLPLSTTPTEKLLSAPARLAESGLKLAFASLAPLSDTGDLRSSAAFAVAAGLDEGAALRALTLDAAELIGVADRVGSIEVGKDGDLVVTAGEPLDVTRPVELVVVDGEIVYEREAR
ncbi:MAG: amidohydrolase family protein [Armatimonadota bacterium]